MKLEIDMRVTLNAQTVKNIIIAAIEKEFPTRKVKHVTFKSHSLTDMRNEVYGTEVTGVEVTLEDRN